MSVDNVYDLDATSVSIRPMCGHHNVQLEVSGRPTLTSEPNTDEDGEVVGWFVDLSEFACPELSGDLEGLGPITVVHTRQVDQMITTDNESWYMQVQLEVTTNWTNKSS
jgi:hypothetical protein